MKSVFQIVDNEFVHAYIGIYIFFYYYPRLKIKFVNKKLLNKSKINIGIFFNQYTMFQFHICILNKQIHIREIYYYVHRYHIQIERFEFFEIIRDNGAITKLLHL